MMLRFAHLSVAVLALSACSMDPAYQRPDPAVPAALPTGAPYPDRTAEGAPQWDYRQLLTDPRLQRVVEQALSRNQDLALAAANVAAARAQARVTRAARLPTITAGAGASVGDSGSGGAQDSYDLDVGLSAFEIDLFGRVRSLSRAALADSLATESAAQAVRIALIAETAQAWLALAADRSLLALAQRTEADARRTVELTTARLRGGIAPRTDLRQAESILAQARADRAQLETAIAQDRHALELLAGGPVADADLAEGIDVASALSAVPAGLDSAILLRRPDVVEAEWRLQAANARIGAARAAMFPRISLTSVLGLASGALGDLFSGDAVNWNAGAGASVPIFDGGARAGNVDLARANFDAALAGYRGTVQAAFREVADALAREGTIAAEERARDLAVAAATDNARLMEARYRGGIDSFLSLLDARRTLYAAQRARVSLALTRATNRVTLARALGSIAPQPGAFDRPAPRD